MKSLLWIALVMASFSFTLHAADPGKLRKERDSLMQRGMWREVVEQYNTTLMTVSDDGSGKDLEKAVEALGNLQAWAEFDPIVERAIAIHAENAKFLQSAAMAYYSAAHMGQIIAGDFRRGGNGYRGWNNDEEATANSGQFVNPFFRDGVRALQLIRQALPKATDDANRAKIWETTALFLGESSANAWKLQTLTPLDVLPSWSETGPSGGTEGVPWTENGPLLYQPPASWDAAKNDGERWRFALAEQVRLDPSSSAKVTMQLASFSQSQFDSATLNRSGWAEPTNPERAKGILQLDTLAEDECLTKTSDGVRRFKLPADQHFIALYRSAFADRSYGGKAGDSLVQIFFSRNQRDKARQILEETLANHGDDKENTRKKLLKQLTGNWGSFGPVESVPAGSPLKLPLVFRNATQVEFTAAPVDMEMVLKDTITYIKSNPRELDYNRTNPAQIAEQLLTRQGEKYLGKATKTWEVALTPNDKYRETAASITAPIETSGAWWIRGKIKGGEEFYTLAWIVDSVFVQRDVAGKKQWWLANAANGQPVPDAEVQFFGYGSFDLEPKNFLSRRAEIRTKEFSRTLDADGKTLLKPSDVDDNYVWIAIARKKGQVPTFYGFERYHAAQESFPQGVRNISYGISDRPLYKPGDTVHLKFFLRNLGYVPANESKYANKSGVLKLFNGRGEEVMKLEGIKTDALGAAEAEIIIPKDATLGRWQASFMVDSSLTATVILRVEEYRKPEYEVTVEAPSEPVKLGEKFTATVKAKYFHGSPVRNANVEITVKRSSLSEKWFPQNRWDWLYGRGSWWYGYEATWHPGWRNWGCIPPHPPWWQGSRWTPDELVLKRNLPIGEDGTAQVEIDTARAKELHGDMDATYSIEARVVDASRREERGSGSVIAARKPFEVVVWTDRGHGKAGEKIEATIAASTLAGKPVSAAKGTLTVFQISRGDGGRVEEKQVQSFPIETDAQGEVKQRFAIPETGQYRIAASLVWKNGDPSEGAALLNIYGEKSAAEWTFGPLELVPDKLTYAPGETMKLRVNSDFAKAHVWLFLHIATGSGREARRVQLDGKSLEVDVPLDLRDMPNMFLEAITVHGGKVHTTTRQVLLPPVSKLIDVTLEPAKPRVKPQEKSSLRVTLRDSEGKPVQGKAVVTIYDKSLEAITGGSNVPPIHENFWSWKNTYYPQGVIDSFPLSGGNFLKKGSVGMSVFGRSPFEGDAFGGMRGDTRLGGRSPRMRSEAAMDGFSAPKSAPMAAMAPAALSEPMEQEAGGSGNSTPILVRKDFADLLKWSGEVTTDAEGHAEIPLEFPDNLTTWKARVWVLGKGTHVGEGSAEIITSKELLIRLQAPRFLVERDESLFSAIVQNDHDAPKTVKVSLELDGKTLAAIDSAPQTVEIAARSEARVEWRVKALTEGEATFRMRADSGDDGDAVERKLPVRVHGMSRQDAWSRVVETGTDSAKIEISVPEERRPDESKLTVKFSPTIAGAVVDAIPYLADYPHGCTEQTLNRFVPAVIAQKMLKSMDINLAEVRAKRTNLNPQELGTSEERAAQWKQWQRNPVFDEAEISSMVGVGVAKLTAMQNSDGGWGWFSGYGEISYPHTTAVVVHGLITAKANGAKIPERVLDLGVSWLVSHERKQVAALQQFVKNEALRKANKKVKSPELAEKSTADSMDAFTRLVIGESGRDSQGMLDFLYRDRIDLPLYAKCLLGLELHRKNDAKRRDEVIKMVMQFLKRDSENQTAYLDLQNQSYWWNWYGSEVEAHAWFLKLLAATQPKNADTRGLAKYLVNNRKNSTFWQSTRDTAFAIEAIADYFTASGEATPKMEVEVLMDGKSLKKVSIDRENLFSFDGTVTLSGAEVTTGKHQLEIKRSGEGTVYANAYLEVFTLEEKLRAAGLEVKVTRTINRLIPQEKTADTVNSKGGVAKQQVQRFKRVPLVDGAKLLSGERIEVELVLESKNDYEYLLFSDAKAAGFEAVEALSGYISGGNGFSTYMEPRDRTVDFFIRTLPRGTHTLRYELRAESPGIYKALPAIATAMYAPELRGNSEDLKLEITK